MRIEMSKKLIALTIFRTIFYQMLLLWAGFSVGFMMNPEYWGNKAPIVQQSMKNIFYPVEYNDEVKEFLVNIGRSRIFLGLPPHATNFKILEDAMISDEQYMADYEYFADDERVVVRGYITKINWKPWEYDYPTLEQIEPKGGKEDFDE